MLGEYLLQYGEVIGYVAVGVIALIALGLIQVIRRRRDLERARVAVRLVTYSIAEPRVGPIAVKGKYRQADSERWLDCRGQRVVLASAVEVVRGTSARWQGGQRTYSVKQGDEAIAIGVMSRTGDGWQLVTSPGEAGIQLYAAEPRPAPAPLLPWRAPLILALCGGIAYGALYETGSLLADVSAKDACSADSTLRLQIAAALPGSRDLALGKLDRCRL